MIVQRKSMNEQVRGRLASGSREQAVRSKIHVLAGKASAYQHEAASSQHLESKSKSRFKGMPFDLATGRKSTGGHGSPVTGLPLGQGTEMPQRSSTAMGLSRQRSRHTGPPNLLHAQSAANVNSIPRLPLEGLENKMGQAENSKQQSFRGILEGEGGSDYNYPNNSKG